MFVWAPIPEPYEELDSVEFCSMLVRDCAVATLARRRLRARRRGLRALRPDRERAAHRPGHAQPAPRPRQAVARASAGSSTGHERVTSPNRHLGTVASVHRFVVRVWLPDRPGALGQVASRIGAVRGDVIGIEILERGGGRAIDELVVALPDDGLIDLLVAEIAQVDGVDVEEVQPVDGDDHDPQLSAPGGGGRPRRGSGTRRRAWTGCARTSGARSRPVGAPWSHAPRRAIVRRRRRRAVGGLDRRLPRGQPPPRRPCRPRRATTWRGPTCPDGTAPWSWGGPAARSGPGSGASSSCWPASAPSWTPPPSRARAIP